MSKAHIWIVSPASARANNGNWQSASRWARFLRTRYRVTITQQWPDHDRADNAPPDLLIALHARRSAASLDAWTRHLPGRPSLLLLTGTDLYRDIQTDASAQRSLRQASALVVLQADGVQAMPPPWRAKTRVIYQSATMLRPASGARRHADICMIGHLREEKDPLTFMRAAALVQAPAARLIHIGGALEPALGQAAQETAARQPRYQWLGAMPHAAARWRSPRTWRAAPTSSSKRCAPACRCWPAISAATAACWATTTPATSRRAMLPRWRG